MASVVGGSPAVPSSNSLIGSFSSAVQQHQHQPAQQQQQPQPPNQPQQQQPPQIKPSVPSNNTPSPPSNPLLPASPAPSLSTPSTPSSLALNSQSQLTSVPTPASGLGLGLGLGLSKIGMTGTSSANQMSGLGLCGHPSSLNTMAGLISGSTPAPYAQAAASGGLGLSSTTQSSISENSTSIPTSGSSGVTTNGAGIGLGLLGSSPAHSSLSGSILGLVPGQNVTPGASQVSPSSVSTTPGVVGMMGSSGGNISVIGGAGVNVAPARPPSGLKQNGSTSMLTYCAWPCVTLFKSKLSSLYKGFSLTFPSPALRLQCCSGRELHRISSKHTEPVTKQPTLISQFFNQSAVSYLLVTWSLLILYMIVVNLSLCCSHSTCCRMDNGPSLISSITLPPSSPSPSFSDSTPGGGSLLNGPHSYTQASEALKVKDLSNEIEH